MPSSIPPSLEQLAVLRYRAVQSVQEGVAVGSALAGGWAAVIARPKNISSIRSGIAAKVTGGGGGGGECY